MAKQPSTNQQQPSLLVIASIAGGLVWWAFNLNSPMVGGQIDWFSALIYGMAGLFSLHAVIRLLENLSHFIDFLASRKPSGQHGSAAWAKPKEINLLRAPCTYPRGKTAGYYGAKNQKRRATLTSKTQTIMLPVARPRGIASSKKI